MAKVAVWVKASEDRGSYCLMRRKWNVIPQIGAVVVIYKSPKYSPSRLDGVVEKIEFIDNMGKLLVSITLDTDPSLVEKFLNREVD